MKPENNIETRTETIQRHAQQCMRETAGSWASFGQSVAEEYARRVPQHKRVINFHSGGDAYKDMRANAQLVDRNLEGTTRLPADLEESIVYALPQPYRDNCIRDLAGRYGLLGARLMSGKESLQEDVEAIGELVTSAGKVTLRLGALIEDGAIDKNDLPHIPQALEDINIAIGNLRAMHHRLESVSGAKLSATVKAIGQ